jgi:hypothetical protein
VESDGAQETFDRTQDELVAPGAVFDGLDLAHPNRTVLVGLPSQDEITRLNFLLK